MPYDVIIIGAGSMGMATGYYLSEQGVKVLLLDKNNPPHDEGSHHGDTRIIRHAYGEGAHYVELALRSQQLWKELEEKQQTTLFQQTGVINIGLTSSEFVQGVIESAKSYQLPLDVMSASEVEARWEGWNIPEDYIGCYESVSGVLYSEACVRTYREGITSHGGEILPYTVVQSITNDDHEVKVQTNKGTFTAKQLIISAGAGTNGVLAHLDEQLPLTTVRKTFSWFDQPETMYDEVVFPAFTCNTHLGMYYGFPNIAGTGVKIGRHDEGHVRDMTKENAPFGSYADDKADVSAFAATFLSPQVEHRKGLPCTYTLTPDNDFIIDYVSDHKNIVVAAGFSGHGFKFASAIGEALSQIVVNGKSDIEVTPFSMNRF